MEKHRGSIVELIALIVLFLGITTFTVAGFAARVWAPPVASAHGAGVDGVIRYLALSTGAVLIIGTVVITSLLWRFGRGRPAGRPSVSARAERWWSLTPVVMIAALAEAGVLAKGLPVWEMIYGAPPPDALVVEVTAQQFEWIVRYPGVDGVFGRTRPDLANASTNPAGLDAADPAALDDIVTRGGLHLPVGRAVVLHLQARDVLHSFSVPQFRVKQDVVPGMMIPTQFVPTVVGRYEIACAELCGAAHYRMRGRVFVHTPEEYQAWLSSQVGFLQ
jgi:cytochrome c oxidase subunit 2